jgi:hypothetical protein
MASLGSFDYLSTQGVPYILLAWMGMWLFRPFATLFHEMGHALIALIFCSGQVSVSVGANGVRTLSVGQRLTIQFSFQRGIEGFTNYSEGECTTPVRFLVLLGGPALSLLISLLSGYLIFRQSNVIWVEIALVSWFCSNFLAFLRAIIPMRLRPTDAFPDGPPSDGMQMYQLFFPPKKNSDY